jgi:thiol-disulfide isomerase/thioredoxin
MKKLLLSIGLILSLTAVNAQIQGYNVGDVVDDFTITTIHGDTVNLYSITETGKYVYIDFFFVDCGPCQATAPHFNQLHETYGCNQGDIYCMSVNTGGDNNEQVENYENTYGGDYSYCPIASGDGGCGVVNSAFNPLAYPTICLIGPDNKLLNADIWPISTYTDFVDALTATGFTPTEMDCETVGIEEVESEFNAVVYPNPASSFINVRLNKNSSIKYIEFYNASGQKIAVKNIESYNGLSEVIFDISDFENGLYFANIIDGYDQVITTKFNVLK